MQIRSIAGVLAAAWTMFSSSAAPAHPLGNFSISHYSGIAVGKDGIEINYVIDMAEIPTFQEIQEHGITADVEDANVQVYVARKAEILRDGLSLQVNGRPLLLQVDSRQVIFPSGAGGLPTMKIGVLFKAKLDAAKGEQWLDYRDQNFPGRAGWKEIIATADPNVQLTSSSVAGADRSRQLSDYPTDLLNSPPQQLTAQIGFLAQSAPPAVASVKNTVASTKPLEPPPPEPAPAPRTDSSLGGSSGGPAVQLTANKQTTPRNSFTEMMATKQLSLSVVLLGLAVAIGLGAFHALEPGHGKTLVAAYLVGSHGTLKHALALGLIVTGAHTAGVYLLGAVTLYAAQYIVPERLYPWLALISGLMIVVLGSVLLLRRYLGKDKLVPHHGHTHHSQDHPHHHEHDHAHGHQHGNHAHHRHEVNQAVSLKQLVTLGISGGIVPCPAALVVLLSAVSVQRIGLGLLLIVAFSVGLAAVLIAVGMLMVCARQFMSRFHGEGGIVTRWLPLTSAVFIVLFGVGLTWQALLSTGFIHL